MIECAHTDCGYKYGWTKKDGENIFVGDDGEFYQIRSQSTKITGHRIYGDNKEMKVLGCPRCHRIFMSCDSIEGGD